jgi:hypothetical protein
MRLLEDVVEDLETDRLSREGEIRLLERTARLSTSVGERTMLKRSLILLTYAHTEGFCKFALGTYASALNSFRLDCAGASAAIAAVGLKKVFAALRNSNSKHDAFRNSFPDDSYLHLCAREQTFVSEFDTISAQTIEIPDELVETRYNVDANVLRKLMFQLGLNFTAVDAHSNEINRLVGVRNAIAHGDRLKVPSDDDAASYVVSAISVMSFLQSEITGALTKKTYLKAPGSAGVSSAGINPA